MQTLKAKSDSKSKKEKLPKDETPKKQEEKSKSSHNSITPRSQYVRKTSAVGAANIYSQTKKTAMAPKKSSSTTNTRKYESPMKNLLKSSPSSTSQMSSRGAKMSTVKEENKTSRLAKDLPFSNVTVNSPVEKRKLILKREQSSKNLKSEHIAQQGDYKRLNEKDKSRSNIMNSHKERERTKTRTLEDDEVKVLTPDSVDNNAAMMDLTKKLKAQPKAFYIDLEENKSQKKETSADEDSYEDDFESYESDFESYHSEESKTEELEEDRDRHEERLSDASQKEVKDEEKMLDSGNFDLRESQRSANRPKVMDHITEDSEDTDFKKTSLTDEGFQDLSSSSAVASMKTYTDVLDRPLFINFEKSKEIKRKKRAFALYQQRAKDLLSMITLHEMSYILFEMKPIAYELYMATFGKSNYTQTAVQTFDDGISVDVQTDDIDSDSKWTQHPVEFSNSNIIYTSNDIKLKYGRRDEDFLAKFTLLINEKADGLKCKAIDENDNYKLNPLRVYLEQKDGAGSGEMLPYEKYKSKMDDNEFSMERLGKFLKKIERKVTKVLYKNAGSSDSESLVKSKLPFSKGYVTLTTKNITDDKIGFLKNSKISATIFSDTKETLIMTVHKNLEKSIVGEKCIICLWDLNVARSVPLKILVAIDNVTISRYRGDTNGLFVSALEDGSINLWDLSEEPTYQNSVASDDKPTISVGNKSVTLTQTERDREWNLNSHAVHEQPVLTSVLQACAYTSSGANVTQKDTTDNIVGLEFTGHAQDGQNGGRKIVGQLCSLQRIGKLTIWSIIQERKVSSPDIGKAYWSKTFLEKTQTVTLFDYLDTTTLDIEASFSLNAAKVRLAAKKEGKMKLSHLKSAVKSDRPASAANLKIKKINGNSWESGLVCGDLKVYDNGGVSSYLVARNCGEVLCCVRIAGAVKVTRLCVAIDTSSVTCLEVSRQGLPYFLAASDTGTVSLYSMLESRVLLTLDCRNRPLTTDRCQSDHKGRFVGTAPSRPSDDGCKHDSGLSIKSLVWSQTNPCSITTLARSGVVHSWDLTRSDIHYVCASEMDARQCTGGYGAMAIITQDGDLQVHRLNDEKSKDFKELFQKYVALL